MSRKLGPESLKSHYARKYSGFYDSYMCGRGLDVGYRGDVPSAEPILRNAVGLDLDTFGYDGLRYAAPDESFDFVYSSHCLEHLSEPATNLRDWYRLTKFGGYVVIIVPHQFLYEKRKNLPSKWNADHKRFYTPGNLLMFVEETLEPNSYRVVHCRDNAADFDYGCGPNVHSSGGYEIELVLRKIRKPEWGLE